LGLFENAVYQSSEINLAPDDLVMLFTDGLYEVPGLNDDIYTQELLLSGVQKRVQLPASQLFDEILEEIKNQSEGGFTDDVCLVGMELANAK